MNIRDLNPAELQAYAARVRESYARELMDADGMDRSEAEHAAEAVISRLLPDGTAAPGQRVCVATEREGGKTLGFLWYGFKGAGAKRKGWIYDIEVLDEAKGQGLGRQLIRWLEGQLAQQGVRHLGLNVFARNTVARALYEKLGFQVTSQQMVKEVFQSVTLGGFTERTIINALTGEVGRLVRADGIALVPEVFDRIAAICNESPVYSTLFASRLDGYPYRPEKAKAFLNWGAQGWKYGTHFLFFAVDSQGLIQAAMDIKSADPEGIEIGYWASATARGLVSNGVAAMCEEAFSAGYSELHAFVVPENTKSAAVLTRIGFQKGTVLENCRGKLCERFSRSYGASRALSR